MKIGIPRTLLYYKNEKLWTTFFKELGVEYIIGPETNREIIRKGANLAIDETCLPTKVLFGQIDYLLDKCDMIFVPRMANCKGNYMCTKFLATYDLVRNTFRDKKPKILYYNLKDRKPKTKMKAFYKMGKYLGCKKKHVALAYQLACEAQQTYELMRTERQKEKLETSEKLKVLVVAHAYNILDKYIGEPIIKQLRKLNCEPIIAEYANEHEADLASVNISKTLPWGFNRHLVGAIDLYHDKIDGIVLLTTFPCGPDSMVNEMIIRKIKDRPILTLTMDVQDGTAGVETRLESYVDILNFRKERYHE